jgi:16S rRNA (cytosine967-C5)-methyltransferase
MKRQGPGHRDQGSGKDKGIGSREQGVGKALGPKGSAGKGPVRGRPASAGPTLSAAESLAKLTPARRVAFEILALVGQGKGHSDELLHSARTEALSAEDRNLATALVMGVLRWEIALDARVRGYLERPEQRLAEPVALALRLGAFQLLHMDRIPAHAALSESVELCRAFGEPFATGMVNAVLRKVAAAQKPGNRIFESAAAFAERLGHPRWLVERWVAAYGREAALKICEAGQKEPDEAAMFAEAGDAVPVMDDGSRLVAELAAAAVPDARRIWDCCAAPGGKTLVLAARETAAEVLATDVSGRRTAQMEARLARYGYGARVRCAVADASVAVKTDEGEFDLILCDVPCSGTGTLARNPEIRHRLQPDELTRQAARQKAILSGALKRLAVGGRLVYSTCSLEPEENERVVDAEVTGAEFRWVPVDGLLRSLRASGVLRESVELESAVRDGALRTLPGVHGCDGFYAVVVERVA